VEEGQGGETRQEEVIPTRAAKMDESGDNDIDGLWKWLQEDIGRNIFSKSNEPPDDWTLIVKLHAMIETGLNGAILLHLSEPALEPIIAKLDTSNQATGKVAFAKALKIIPKASAIFIQQLSEFRNYCVHDIQHFDFDLQKHLDGMKPDRKKQFTKAVRDLIKNLTAPTIQHQLYVCTIMTMASIHGHALRCNERDLTAKSAAAMKEWDAMWREFHQSIAKE
jgi:hypothetical protein